MTTGSAPSWVRTGALAALFAGLAAAAVWLVGVALDVGLEVAAPGGGDIAQVPLVVSVLFAAVLAVLGTVVAALLAARTARPVPLFLGAVVVVLLLFGVTPFTQADDAATILVLQVMHLAVAAAALAAILPALRARTGAPQTV